MHRSTWSVRYARNALLELINISYTYSELLPEQHVNVQHLVIGATVIEFLFFIKETTKKNNGILHLVWYYHPVLHVMSLGVH